MPKVNAKLKYLRISPRKARLVADTIRGLPVSDAKAQLHLSPKRVSTHLEKLLGSAVASATHNNQLEESKLYIDEIRVDKGPTLKRWRPRARGSASKIEKKTSHVTLVLDTNEKLARTEYVYPEKEVKEKKDKKAATKGSAEAKRGATKGSAEAKRGATKGSAEAKRGATGATEGSPEPKGGRSLDEGGKPTQGIKPDLTTREVKDVQKSKKEVGSLRRFFRRKRI